MCAKPLFCDDQLFLVFRSTQGYCCGSLQFRRRLEFARLGAKIATASGLGEGKHELHTLQFGDSVSVEGFPGR